MTLKENNDKIRAIDVGLARKRKFLRAIAKKRGWPIFELKVGDPLAPEEMIGMPVGEVHESLGFAFPPPPPLVLGDIVDGVQNAKYIVTSWDITEAQELACKLIREERKFVCTHVPPHGLTVRWGWEFKWND